MVRWLAAFVDPLSLAWALLPLPSSLLCAPAHATVMSRSTLARALLCVSIALLFTIATAQQLQTVTCTYTSYTEASFTVPAGVTSLSAYPTVRSVG